METFEGILFATTNLTDNFDKAFERRFLFKIYFEKPKADVRQQIWMSVLPTLSSDDATMLATRYDFTGLSGLYNDSGFDRELGILSKDITGIR